MQFPGQTPFFYPQQQQAPASGGSSIGLILLLLLTPVAAAGGVFLFTFQKIKKAVTTLDVLGTMSVDLVAATLFSLKAGVLNPTVVMQGMGNQTQFAIATTTKTAQNATGAVDSVTIYNKMPLTIAHLK